MANHPEGANRYIISKTWAEVMQPSPAKGEAEAYHLPLMVRATQPETAHFGEAAANGGGMEPFHYTVEGRVSSARPPARKPSDNDYVGDDYDGKPTKTMIAHMPRATLLEWLPGATGTVAELRAQLRDQLYPGSDMGNVEKFYPKNAAEKADNVLEQAIGDYDEVLVIGWDHDGDLDARATLGLKDGGDILWLIEAFKRNMLDGVYGGDDE